MQMGIRSSCRSLRFVVRSTSKISMPRLVGGAPLNEQFAALCRGRRLTAGTLRWRLKRQKALWPSDRDRWSPWQLAADAFVAAGDGISRHRFGGEGHAIGEVGR